MYKCLVGLNFSIVEAKGVAEFCVGGGCRMGTEVVCEEARISRGRRARRLRSPQGASRNAGEHVELSGPWDSEVQATSLGHQGTEALGGRLEDVGMHLGLVPSCCAWLFTLQLDLSPP